ncbi:MAG: hypothetical protein FJX75_25675 [Armatimonadetes bacterium]|nr:hypothetical protein [Armatimonadota bacterium]
MPAALWCMMASVPALSQQCAVYESEANAAQYRGIYQEPLRSWLAARGVTFEVIGDEAASDGDRLSRYELILASSVYIVPDGAAQGLTEYVRAGGRVIWFDSPARCREAVFRDALGLGPETTYAPLADVALKRLGGPHPAALSIGGCAAQRLVGNPATSATVGATVLYEMTGMAANGAPGAYPAVVYNQYGSGKALVYNWVVWSNGEADVGAMLRDGLDYMLADARLSRQTAVVFGAPRGSTARQPEPLIADCKVYRKPTEPDPTFRCIASLIAAGGREVTSSQSEPLQWTPPVADVTAAHAEIRLPTAGLADGRYSLRFHVGGGPTDETCEATVELTGQRWAALRESERQRRKLLEPNLVGTLGDYDAEPRTPEGRVDLPRVMEQIKTAHMTMYDFLIWHEETDWEDFQAFLPLAEEAGIKVWVTLCPPSEQGGGFPWSEPYRLDYVRWADEIGKLAERYDNLVALVIDDFWSSSNHQLFTPDYIAQVVETLRKHDPKLAFLPTIYWPTVGEAEWIETYGLIIDGIVFPYCEYATGDELEAQLAACRKWIGPDKFLLVNVYASGSGGGNPPPRTPEYMRRTLTVSREHADGIRLYCLPKGKLLDDPVYAVTAELYGQWAASRTK